MMLNELVENLTYDSGVFKPNAGSIALAEVASDYSGRFLDIGTGSGFLTIALYQKGLQGDATDSSRMALNCAKKNFDNFGIDVKLIDSDLYSNVSDTYDLILFNPPTNMDENESHRGLKNSLKDSLPSFILSPLARIHHHIHRKDRREKLVDFIQESRNYLNENGIFLLNVLTMDVNALKESRKGLHITEKMAVGINTGLEIKYT